jgi:ketosteroid isomerase-like protein
MKITLSIILLAALGMTAMPQQKSARPELVALVEAERSFSRTCVAKGLRASFIEFFADDGVRFLPDPVNAQENFRRTPAPTAPQSFTLSWEPIFADISQAGDLGFTTGPYVVSDNAKKNPPSYGYYFSIWRKQSDGNWKVLIDYGTDLPASAATTTPAFKAASDSGWKRNAAKAGMNDSTALTNLDQQTGTQSATQGVAAFYRQYLLRDARLHREGQVPLVETNSILGYLERQQWTKLSFDPIAAGMAQSGDLGYTYGKYSLQKKGDSSDFEKGYYVRVWKRDGKGNWKIAMEVAKALPAAKP